MELIMGTFLITALSPVVVGFIWILVDLAQQMRYAREDDPDRVSKS
jgi:hypothetical protein